MHIGDRDKLTSRIQKSKRHRPKRRIYMAYLNSMKIGSAYAAVLLCVPDCSFEDPWIGKEFPNVGASAVNEAVSAIPLRRINANYDSVQVRAS